MSKRIQLSPVVNIRDNKRIRYTEDGMAVTTLTLSPLGKEVTASQLIDYFSSFGPVDNIHITSLGYATFGSVKFTHAESAAQALEIRSHSFAGHNTSVTVATSRYQEESIKDNLPVELTNVTGTCLVDLNEDCLSKMFSSQYLGLMDLCSVAETCSRLKDVAMEIFRRERSVITIHSDKYEKSLIMVDDKETVIMINEPERIFFNFGSVISELKIYSTRILNERTNHIMDLVITYCCNTLESLVLNECTIDESMEKRLIPLFNQLAKLYLKNVHIEGGCNDLFANCKSLVELTVVLDLSLDTYNATEEYILRCCKNVGENTFPKLRNFKYGRGDYTMYDWQNFILRHKTLITVSLDVVDDYSSLLPIIAENCGQLEKLKIRASGEEMSRVDYENTLKSILVLDHLKVLKLHCVDENVTKFIRELHRLKSLEFLDLLYANDVFEFISELSQLKKLKVLRLTECGEAKYLNLLGNLEHLTELRLDFDYGCTDLNLDVVDMVKRLINLKTLEVRMDEFKIDRKTYLRIVHAVQSRPDRVKKFLSIKCAKDFTLDDDDNNGQIVKMMGRFDSIMN